MEERVNHPAHIAKVLTEYLVQAFGPAKAGECCGGDTYLVEVENGIGTWRCFGCGLESYEYDLE